MCVAFFQTLLVIRIVSYEHLKNNILGVVELVRFVFSHFTNKCARYFQTEIFFKVYTKTKKFKLLFDR